MNKAEDIIKQYIEQLSACPICKSEHIVLEERLSRITVFDITKVPLEAGFKSKPMVHYEFRCSACRHIFVSDTVNDGDWNVSWTLLGDIFAKKRMSRITANSITKSKIQEKLKING